jgi:hypothetical protein
LGGRCREENAITAALARGPRGVESGDDGFSHGASPRHGPAICPLSLEAGEGLDGRDARGVERWPQQQDPSWQRAHLQTRRWAAASSPEDETDSAQARSPPNASVSNTPSTALVFFFGGNDWRSCICLHLSLYCRCAAPSAVFIQVPVMVKPMRRHVKGVED